MGFTQFCKNFFNKDKQWNTQDIEELIKEYQKQMPRKPKIKPFEIVKASDGAYKGQYMGIVTSPATGDKLYKSTEFYKNKLDCFNATFSTYLILKKYFESLVENVETEVKTETTK